MFLVANGVCFARGSILWFIWRQRKEKHSIFAVILLKKSVFVCARFRKCKMNWRFFQKDILISQVWTDWKLNVICWLEYGFDGSLNTILLIIGRWVRLPCHWCGRNWHMPNRHTNYFRSFSTLVQINMFSGAVNLLFVLIRVARGITSCFWVATFIPKISYCVRLEDKAQTFAVPDRASDERNDNIWAPTLCR